MFKRAVYFVYLWFRRNMNGEPCDGFQCLLTHYVHESHILLSPLMTNTFSSSSASSPLLLFKKASPSVTLFSPFSWGRVRWAQDRGECELWWATDQNNWYFFIRTHVHPPTHKVTHACTVTHTHTHIRTDRRPFYLIPGERCSWIYFGCARRDVVCWYPVLEMDLHGEWSRPCVDAVYELRNSKFCQLSELQTRT